jgi:arsenite methyltransferase
MNKQQEFFNFAAKVGLTKHIGGIEATEMLIELCQISKDKHILDVGCGAGVTPVFLAKTIGCSVVGVDISEGMVQRSNQRAKKERLADRIECRIADAQDLPFDDHSFDAVITESVTAFPEDKQKAVNEYVRVTKSGGYIGLNESTWLKVPPPPELIAWASQDLGANVKPLTSGEWTGLLETAGLQGIITRTSDINVKDEAKGIYRRYGFGGTLGIMFRMLSLFAKCPAYRKFVKQVKKDGVAPKNLDEYFGYGIYVGQK